MSQQNMKPIIRRDFVQVGSGCFHYRHTGQGPVVVMLHQSPQNSAMWVEQMAWLGRDYLVLAPDLPGFGFSDPLPIGQPEIADLSQACHAWLDALGIDQCAVFGMHTGGMVAVHMGLDRPDRVGLVMVDGYAIFNDAERALLDTDYLPPFQPDWSGQHLRWLWARMREQSFFFPWCRQEAEFALSYPAPDLEKIQPAVMDILAVGDQYRLGYRAALQFADRDCVARLSMPTRLYYRQDDVLIGHRERLPDLPSHIAAPCLADQSELWAAVRDELALWRGPDELPSQAVATSGWQRRIINTPCGEVACWVLWPERSVNKLKLVLHGLAQAPFRPATEQSEQDREAEAGQMLIWPDLPGHGASTEACDQSFELDELAAALVDMATQLAGAVDLSIEAHQGSAALSLALAQRWPGSISALALVDPWLLNQAELDWLIEHLPRLEPMPAGGHLLEAWQWERERHFYPPWKPPLAEHRIPGPAPDVNEVQANVVGLLGLGLRLKGLMTALLRPDLDAVMVKADFPVSLSFDPMRDDGRLAELEQGLQSGTRRPHSTRLEETSA